jgi:hypothetical protein
MVHIEPGDSDESMAEFYPYDGSTTWWLGGHLTEWDLTGTEVHEEMHRIIEECLGNDGIETTEKQDHWIIQRLCF